MYLINFRHDCMWSGRCSKCSDVPNIQSTVQLHNDHTYSFSSSSIPIKSSDSDSIERLRSSERLRLRSSERLILRSSERLRKLRELIKISHFSSKNMALSVPATENHKKNHNELERQRRKNLTNLFNDLKHELSSPQSSNANNNISKINILRQATVCCTNFTLRDKLINENKILKNKLSQLVRSQNRK